MHTGDPKADMREGFTSCLFLMLPWPADWLVNAQMPVLVQITRAHLCNANSGLCEVKQQLQQELKRHEYEGGNSFPLPSSRPLV